MPTTIPPLLLLGRIQTLREAATMTRELAKQDRASWRAVVMQLDSISRDLEDVERAVMEVVGVKDE